LEFANLGNVQASFSGAWRRESRSKSPIEDVPSLSSLPCAIDPHWNGFGKRATWSRARRILMTSLRRSKLRGEASFPRRFSNGCANVSAERATYLDSSAIVKLAVYEPGSAELRRYLKRRRPLVSSAVARTEVARALLPSGSEVSKRGQDVLSRLELARINDRVLTDAGRLLPADLRSLDAIHLATAQQFGADLGSFVTYDDRLAMAARGLGLKVVAPA
jgi:uncharacterized protein